MLRVCGLSRLGAAFEAQHHDALGHDPLRHVNQTRHGIRVSPQDLFVSEVGAQPEAKKNETRDAGMKGVIVKIKKNTSESRRRHSSSDEPRSGKTRATKGSPF